MITIKDLHFGYEGQPAVFKGFNARIETGEHIYLKGSSGSGKTTFLRLITGLEKPSGGSIYNDASSISPVFQEDRLIEYMTAAENIRFGNRRDASGIIGDMHIEHLLDKKIPELSGGEKRRIAIARALAHGGDLLILDEPFNGIDEENITVCVDAIKKHAGESTIIMATHHPEQAEKLNCRVLEIE
ncbi:MAG: ATP-binding cassette domain-containing protein [Lachnospiraceae bacterium]|nr:ATP-binding cassette domain-containing protein [Lachnospiraceae bacterium]